MKVSRNSIRWATADRGMGLEPMSHRQDADATAHGPDARATRRIANRRRGFTLAEVLVASTISGFIAIVAVGALNAVSRTAQTVNRVSEVNAEIRFAARMLARDLANLYRDPDPENIKLIGVSQGAETGGPPFLTFYTVGRAKARGDQPEGDVYEVEYFLGMRQEEETAPDRAAVGETAEESMVLFRRVWPNPDKDRPPGGILTPIAENIAVFFIRFYDGKDWGGEWTEEMRSLPQLIEVTLGTAPPEKGDPVLETFTISFPRRAEIQGGVAGPGESQGEQGNQERQESSSESSGGQDNSGGGSSEQNRGEQGNAGRGRR
jgi:type II secretion system protein J